MSGLNTFSNRWVVATRVQDVLDHVAKSQYLLKQVGRCDLTMTVTRKWHRVSQYLLKQVGRCDPIFVVHHLAGPESQYLLKQVGRCDESKHLKLLALLSLNTFSNRWVVATWFKGKGLRKLSVSIPSQTGGSLRRGYPCQPFSVAGSQYLLKQVGRCDLIDRSSLCRDSVSIPSQTGGSLRHVVLVRHQDRGRSQYLLKQVGRCDSQPEKIYNILLLLQRAKLQARKETSATRRQAKKFYRQFNRLCSIFLSRTPAEKTCRNKQKINRLHKTTIWEPKVRATHITSSPKPCLHCLFPGDSPCPYNGQTVLLANYWQRLRQRNIMAELSAATSALFAGNNQDRISPVPRPVS